MDISIYRLVCRRVLDAKHEKKTRRVRIFFTLLAIIIAGCISTAGMLANPRLETNFQLQGQSQGSASSFHPAPLSTAALGVTLELDDARTSIKLDFSLPTYLPEGSVLSEIRVRDGKSVALIYDNKDLPPIPQYVDEIEILILILRDETTFEGSAVEPTIQVTVAVTDETGTTTMVENVTGVGADRQVTVSVNGAHGRGYGPADLAGFHDSGRVEWWDNGIHYEVLADIPLEQLLEIAESM